MPLPVAVRGDLLSGGPAELRREDFRGDLGLAHGDESLIEVEISCRQVPSPGRDNCQLAGRNGPHESAPIAPSTEARGDCKPVDINELFIQLPRDHARQLFAFEHPTPLHGAQGNDIFSGFSELRDPVESNQRCLNRVRGLLNLDDSPCDFRVGWVDHSNHSRQATNVIDTEQASIGRWRHRSPCLPALSKAEAPGCDSVLLEARMPLQIGEQLIGVVGRHTDLEEASDVELDASCLGVSLGIPVKPCPGPTEIQPHEPEPSSRRGEGEHLRAANVGHRNRSLASAGPDLQGLIVECDAVVAVHG
jgi:hypothetical protein